MPCTRTTNKRAPGITSSAQSIHRPIRKRGTQKRDGELEQLTGNAANTEHIGRKSEHGGKSDR